MKSKTKMKPLVAMAALLPFLGLSVEASATEILVKEPPHRIYHVIQNKTLAQAANQIANRSGIGFKINAADQADIISRKIAAEDWKSALAQLLQGYNYSTVMEKGGIRTVIVTGENGSGKAASELVHIQQKLLNNVPEQYKHFKPGSVMPLTLPVARMKATPVGKKLILDLPIGQYRINHDNFVDHGDGTSTWIGYLDEEGKGYRVYLSEGEAGLMGNIYTPDGVYNIEQANGETVLVDLNNSGLQSAGYENDQAEVASSRAYFPLPTLINSNSARSAAATASTGILGSATAARTGSLGAATGPVVDVMVLYTAVKQTATAANQKIKYYIDISNQAYLDSKINMRLRLVYSGLTRYSESNYNGQALNDLTQALNDPINYKGAFSGTAALRNKYGADLVMLFRPYYARTSGNCGYTYVGFAGGSPADARYGYGTISDGYSKDSLTNYYCGSTTFTHEIGHSFGNVHDREYSSFTGRYPYSYAWGVQGRFGTIMSYKTPALMLFSSPLLATQCKGSPCGYAAGTARASDQSRTVNSTAPLVANYRPKKI